jgi:PIN domain nuclease of toxin-antitoxin system
VFVSAASAWEIVIKQWLGKLRFEGSIAGAIAACRFSELAITIRHAEAIKEVPRHHSDPFDRMLIAQVAVEALTILTHDQAFEAYPVSVVLT